MESRVEKAVENNKKGYNCSQAVACTYCDLVGIDEKTMFKIMEGYGLGMGCADGTCGAVSGAIALAGMKNSRGELEGPYTKGETYKISKDIVNQFLEKNKSIVCKELKGIGTGKVLRSCEGCIRDAAEIIEKILADK